MLRRAAYTAWTHRTERAVPHMSDPPTNPVSPKRLALPAGVWGLGLCSLFMDVSSELIHSLLPVFLTTVLGASMVTVGLIEGAAEATAAIAKVFSGALSDWIGRRKPLALAGYGLAALVKPIFPLAGSVAWVFAARFLDRLGKGIRGAPRDALVADITAPGQRGAAYGLRQALDSVGAMLGPLAAILFLFLFAGDVRAVLWVAVVPAVIAVLILLVLVREPEGTAVRAPRLPIAREDLADLGRRYWLVVLLGAVLTLARFSEAFLVLRAENVGLPIAWVPAVMVVMSGVYAAVSYPAGHAADRGGRGALLFWGLAALIAADLLLAMSSGTATLFVGVALWGAHMGLTQGLLATLVAEAVPADRRGTAFGVFNLVTGVFLLVASLLAGWLWSIAGPAATFIAGAAFTSVALAGLALYRLRSGGGRPAPSR